jgi:cell division protease FtsH
MTSSGEHVHSEETVREIDLEIKRIIDTAYDTVFEILIARRPVIEHLTKELLEREVMDGKQIQEILDQYKTGPRIAHGTFAPHNPTTAPGEQETDRGENRDLRADA